MIAARVRWAFFTPGSRKAFTPSLTASTPVRGVQPLAHTFRSSQKVTVAVTGPGPGRGVTGTGWPPLSTTRITPPTIRTSTIHRCGRFSMIAQKCETASGVDQNSGEGQAGRPQAANFTALRRGSAWSNLQYRVADRM
jgi:hypothetical protein